MLVMDSEIVRDFKEEQPLKASYTMLATDWGISMDFEEERIIIEVCSNFTSNKMCFTLIVFKLKQP